MLNVIVKDSEPEAPIMTMIVPGRRALGESWSKVTVTPNATTGAYDVQREDTEAPADNSPIFVPGLGNISVAMADYILEYQRHMAQERAKRPRQSQQEVTAEVNALWFDFVEQLLRWRKGQTTLGVGGFNQRERIDRWPTN